MTLVDKVTHNIVEEMELNLSADLRKDLYKKLDQMKEDYDNQWSIPTPINCSRTYRFNHHSAKHRELIMLGFLLAQIQLTENTRLGNALKEEE